MPKRDAPKQNKGERNTERKNGKASKKDGHRQRTMRTNLTPVEKVNMGGGLYVNVAHRWAQNA